MSFLKKRKGVAAVEFALVAPIFVALLFGSVELTHWLWAGGKVDDASSTIGDLVAQETVITDDSLGAIMRAAPRVMEPYNANGLEFDITSVVACYTGGDTTTTPDYIVTWSRSWGSGTVTTGPHTRDQALPDLAGALRIGHGDSLIVAEAKYTYTPRVDYFDVGSIDFVKTVFYQPRESTRVAYPGVEANPVMSCADYGY